jgi:hypothetical protein
MTRSALRSWSLLLLATLSFAACDSGGGGGSPTEPGGTLTLTASPSQIGRTGTSTLTATARQRNGQPVTAGTQVSFTSSLGTVPTTAATDNNGQAVVTLRGDGRTGVATVTASLAAGPTASTTVTIVPGLTVSLTVDPSAVPLNGTAAVTATVREANGQPAPAGLRVQLATTLGRFDDPAPLTDGAGTARARLNGGSTPGRATVTATVDGAAAPASAELSVGEGLTLTLRASPDSIGPNGTTEIAALVFEADGSPATGVRVLLETTLGRLDDTGPVVDALGVARATLRGDGRTGDARVRAEIPGRNVTAELVVPIR